jgi:hypothetical protein
MGKRIEVEEGCGIVLADIGLPNPEDRLATADLAIRITLPKPFARADSPKLAPPTP